MDGDRRQRRHPQPVGSRRARPAAHRVARRRRWPPGWWRPPPRRTAAARSASRRPLRAGGDEADPGPGPPAAAAGWGCRRTAPWRGRSPTARSCSTSCMAPAPGDPHHAPAFTGSYVAGRRDRARAPADRDVAQAAARAAGAAVGRPARRLGAHRRAAERARPRRRPARPGLRAGPARVPPDVAPRHLRGVTARSRTARRWSAARARWPRWAATWCRRAGATASWPARARTTARITALWDEFDVLLTPALAKTAIAAEGGYGKPGAGRDRHRRPLHAVHADLQPHRPAGDLDPGGRRRPTDCRSRVQLVGRVGAEDTLYSLAGQIEAAAPWAQRRPHGVMTRAIRPVAGHRRACRGGARGGGHGVGQDGVAVPARGTRRTRAT